MPWVAHASSIIGDREEQQDRYLIVRSDDGGSQLLVVADGAGGHKFGALAAQTAIKFIAKKAQSLWLCDDPITFLNDLIIECNQSVLKVGESDLACTTIVLAFTKGEELYWGHVGDSRFYLIRGGKVVSRSRDHSIEELKQSEKGQEIMAHLKPSANGLFMCLGARPQVTPEIGSSMARIEDSLILCSDGLWGQLDMGPMISELSQQPITPERLEFWADKARKNKSGSSDNISIIAAQFVKKPPFWSRLISKISGIFGSRQQ